MVKKAVEATKTFMTREMGLESTVVGVEKTETGWEVTAEATVVDVEMRRLAKRDLVSSFELVLDSNYNVTSFTRKGMRERGSVAP